MIDDRFLDWFAGFVAGEGYFALRRRLNGRQYTASVSINLRDDDLSILLEIQKTLRMGTIHREIKPMANPQAKWHVTRSSDLVRLVSIFYEHPLRAKKQVDFEIWAEAVLEIDRGGRRGRQRVQYDIGRLNYLCQKLRLIRRYNGFDMPWEEEEQQMELPWPDEEEEKGAY